MSKFVGLPILSDSKFVEYYRQKRDPNFIVYFYNCIKKLNVYNFNRAIHSNVQEMIKIIIKQRQEFLDKIIELELNVKNLGEEKMELKQNFDDEKMKNDSEKYQLQESNSKLAAEKKNLEGQILVARQTINKWVNEALQDHEEVGRFREENEKLNCTIEKLKAENQELQKFVVENEKLCKALKKEGKKIKNFQEKIGSQNKKTRKMRKNLEEKYSGSSSKKPKQNNNSNNPCPNWPTTSTEAPRGSATAAVPVPVPVQKTSTVSPRLPSLTPPGAAPTNYQNLSFRSLHQFKCFVTPPNGEIIERHVNHQNPQEQPSPMPLQPHHVVAPSQPPTPIAVTYNPQTIQQQHHHQPLPPLILQLPSPNIPRHQPLHQQRPTIPPPAIHPPIMQQQQQQHQHQQQQHQNMLLAHQLQHHQHHQQQQQEEQQRFIHHNQLNFLPQQQLPPHLPQPPPPTVPSTIPPSNNNELMFHFRNYLNSLPLQERNQLLNSAGIPTNPI